MALSTSKSSWYPLTIASLFYSIDEQLQTAQIILEGDLN